MLINWRDKEYTFHVKSLIAKHDGEQKKTVDKNIYAFDTEEVLNNKTYEMMCYQVSSPLDGEKLKYVEPGAKAFELFIDDFVRSYSWRELDQHYTLLYGHNLMYDWLQLVKLYPELLAMCRTGLGLNTDYEILKNSDYKLTLRKNALFTGNAPHFSIQVYCSKREWFDLMFYDTFSFFPTSLKKLSKDLGLEVQKMERQEDIGLRDYRKEGDSPDKQYFEKYAKIDALATRLTGEKIRELHEHADMNRIRVSSPSFAISYLFTNLPEGTELRNGIEDQKIMQLVLETYSGGRTGGIYHGAVKDITVLDFHSSYPTSMCSLPSFLTTMDYIVYPDPENLTIDELLEIIDEVHCFMRIDGEETDSLYPSLIKNVKGKLTPVFGEFHNLSTTGVEVSVGLKSHKLKISRIYDLVMLVEMEPPKILPFKDFAETAYSRKENSEKGSTEYQSAKLVLNSSYGKLIESRTETPVDDTVRDICLPAVPGMETDFGRMYYEKYIESLRPDSEKSFIDSFPEIIEEIMKNFDQDDLKYYNFGKLSLTKLEYGRYVIPAAASLITATSRARLTALMKCTHAIYWDTDSVFIENFDKTKVDQELKEGSELLPPFIQKLSIGDHLGELDMEIEHAAGYLAGTKRYYIETADHKHIKKALHGIPTAPYNRAEEMIQTLATGSNFSYEGNKKPLSSKETKDVASIGKFVSHKYISQFHLDDRLTWVKNKSGWSGSVKPINEMEGIK